MFIRGVVYGDKLVCRPGIHAVDALSPMPSIDEVMEKNWYFTATTWSGSSVNNFPQGRGLPVLIPYILRTAVEYPLAWFERWTGEDLPEPLRIYR
jgi:hypothetical protein